MKIIAISASTIPSNTANSIQVMKACQALVQIGHQVILLVPGNPPENMNSQQIASHYGLQTPFETHWLPGRDRRLFTWKAVRMGISLGGEVLYVWPLQSAVLGLLAGKPVILELHDLPTGTFGTLLYRWFLHMGGCKRQLLITNALRNALEGKYKVSLRGRDTVIAPNGVDLERFASLPDPTDARHQIGLSDRLTVACTGHLYAGRGVDLFLKLAETFPQAQFLWAGGQPKDVSEWQKQATASGLQNVNFTGFVPNEHLPLYQAAADVLLMPYGQRIAISSGVGHSAEVASPMKMFEYMACGRAIITSDLPVFREVLDESKAVFCPPEDADAWKAALGNLLADDRRRQTLAQRARDDAEQYSWVRRAAKAMEGFLE